MPLWIYIVFAIAWLSPRTSISMVTNDTHDVTTPLTNNDARPLKHAEIQCKPCICKIRRDLKLVANCTGRNLTNLTLIPNLPLNIDVLLVDFNDISQLESGCLSNYANLTELNLAFNNISTMQVGCFHNLHKLQILNLAGNKLKYDDTVFKTNVFKPLKDLKVLLLNNNSPVSNDNPMYPDKAISDLVSLQYLYMDGLTNQSFGNGFSNLSFLTHLSLAGEEGNCSLQFLFNDTFISLKHVQLLNLSHCNVLHIEPDTFSPLKASLDVLDLSYNRKLKFINLGVGLYGLQNSSVRVLNISGIVGIRERCVCVTKMNIHSLHFTVIQEIYADDNIIEYIEKDALLLLPPTLKKISIVNNRFIYGSYMSQLYLLTGLVEIDLSGVAKSHRLPFANTQFGEDESSCSSNSEFNIETTYNAALITDIKSKHDLSNIATERKPNTWWLPQNLKILKYTFSELWYNVTEITVGVNSLSHVDFSNNMLSYLYGPIKGLENITYLNLSHNIAFVVRPTFFQNLTSLEILDVSCNFLFPAIVEDIEGKLFENLKSLKNLNLTENAIHRLPENVFQGLGNLQHLQLSRNSLYHVPLQVNHMKHLETVDLSHNNIRLLPKDFIADLDSIIQTQNHSVSIDLSFNPITCECYNLNFLKWMLNSKVKQSNLEHYYCINPNGDILNLTDLRAVVEKMDDMCRNYFGLAIICLTVVLLLLCISLSGVMYRYRWKLRYWYYAARYRFKRLQDNSQYMQINFKFDAFISYASEDRQFVHNEMITMMEERAGKKLNIHQRDFCPGQPISSNIVEAIKESRKTVLVLSTHFLNSEWCEYEMQMAIRESVHTGRDVVLVLMLEEIPCEIIPKEILHLLQTDSYIEYRNEECNEVFWQRLVDAIERS